MNLSSWIRCFRKCTTLSNRNAFAKTINAAIKPAPFPTKKKRNVLFHLRDISNPAHIQKGVFHLKATYANLHVSWWIRWMLSCFAMSSRYIYFEWMLSHQRDQENHYSTIVACNRNTLNLCFASHLWIKCALWVSDDSRQRDLFRGQQEFSGQQLSGLIGGHLLVIFLFLCWGQSKIFSECIQCKNV